MTFSASSSPTGNTIGPAKPAASSAEYISSALTCSIGIGIITIADMSILSDMSIANTLFFNKYFFIRHLPNQIVLRIFCKLYRHFNFSRKFPIHSIL
jgi:hypothetical protein